MGFDLINNFRRPYLSVSVTDFWRRWHISLSTWLKDYVYIPMGGNRCSKVRNYFNIFITFLVSGIWHGANWTFILWGVLHGFFQMVEKALNWQKYDKINFTRILRILVTFALVTLAWILFRMPSIHDAVAVISRIFSDLPSSLYRATNTDMVTMALSLITIVVTDIVGEYSSFSLIANKHRAVRWITYFVLLFSILLFGVLNTSSFIYASF
ncbi:MAG: MBOAT family O-acyltransferase, partial [Muribaculaceae bacterium]